MPPAIPPLSPLDARVLGVLVEKQHTVPDTYPLTLNALTSGCNQKSSRDPVMDVSETDVQASLDRLRARSLVIESSGGRVMRYAHNVERALALESQAVALLATLMLRGPQTAGELRINSERMHRFADISAVEAFLHQLAEPPASMVEELPRAPGARESRWRHRLVAAEATPPADSASGGAASHRSDAQSGRYMQQPGDPALRTQDELAALRAEVNALRGEVEALKARIEGLVSAR